MVDVYLLLHGARIRARLTRASVEDLRLVAADAAAGTGNSREQLASLAGQASGSAARSLLGGYVELENAGDDIRLHELCAADEWPLAVVIAITASGPKPVSSTVAMETPDSPTFPKMSGRS